MTFYTSSFKLPEEMSLKKNKINTIQKYYNNGMFEEGRMEVTQTMC